MQLQQIPQHTKDTSTTEQPPRPIAPMEQNQPEPMRHTVYCGKPLGAQMIMSPRNLTLSFKLIDLGFALICLRLCLVSSLLELEKNNILFRYYRSLKLRDFVRLKRLKCFRETLNILERLYIIQRDLRYFRDALEFEGNYGYFKETAFNVLSYLKIGTFNIGSALYCDIDISIRSQG